MFKIFFYYKCKTKIAKSINLNMRNVYIESDYGVAYKDVKIIKDTIF